MKYCSACGNNIDDNAAFCGYCGKPTYNRAGDRALQEECLHTLYHRLCTERRVWRIFAFVFLGFTVSFFVPGLLFLCDLILGSLIGEVLDIANGDIFPVMGIVYFIYARSVFLPICIINFVVVSKLNYYVATYYGDVGPTVERCGNPGAIVLGALCNSIALIFIIINFVYIKRNADVFAQIRANQLAANSGREFTCK